MTDHKITVGLMHAPAIDVTFRTPYTATDGTVYTGRHTFTAPVSLRGSEFTLHGALIGIDFHWEQRRDLTYRGDLTIEESEEHEGCLCAVNSVDVEEYLASVISSEMAPTASPALLRAHAVISRTWALRRMTRRAGERSLPPPPGADEIVKWWDEQDHTRYAVCADDHCQRYQGISTGLLPEVESAIADTRSLVLTDAAGALVDARFSKCCGGVTEIFSTCWEDADHPCLPSLADADGAVTVPDLTTEEGARQWIASRPAMCHCGRSTAQLRSTVLNDYDRATTDFYRWERELTPSQLRETVRAATGRDLGEITALEPLRRGPSGRIMRLRVRGTAGELVIGKELLIRRALAADCLYSSAFVAERTAHGHFLLRGAGWGHGVGLCQIGAAVMGAEGRGWREILSHYYPGATLKPYAE